jgi:hypothetical protein
MPKYNNIVAEQDLKALREGIKNKYQEYHLRDKVKFPNFEFNSSRANYQPLKDSFEEEFYVVRGIDRVDNNIHIPSTNTLALIYSDTTYIPGNKILNTCQLYVESKSEAAFETTLSDGAHLIPTGNSSKNWVKTGVTILIGVIVLIGLVVYLYNLSSSTAPASGLIIDLPSNSQLVPRQLVAEGKVSHATTVWVVVRLGKSSRYWVQPEAKADDMGRWKGHIYIGSEDKADIGLRAQIRAFVNPAKSLKEGEVLYSWPDAQLSSGLIEVIRGPETSK